MKTYELVIEQRRPTCGGRSPTKCEILTVTTDDPLAYVKSHEPNCVPEIVKYENGVTLIQLEHNGMWVKYEFTED